MSEDFNISMIVALTVGFVGFFSWVAAFLMGFGLQLEAYFFGFSFGGVVVAVVSFIIHAITRKADAKEGEEL